MAGQTNKTGSVTEDYVQSGGSIVTGATGTNSTLNDVHVHHNTVSNTGGGRTEDPYRFHGHQGSGVLVEYNTVKDVGGDGVIVSYADSPPMIQYNDASGIGNGVYPPFSGGNFAGIWVLGDHNPTIQKNAVYDTTKMSAADSQPSTATGGTPATARSSTTTAVTTSAASSSTATAAARSAVPSRSSATTSPRTTAV